MNNYHPENWTENTEANEDSIFLTQEERDSASVEKMNWENVIDCFKV